MSWLRGVFRRLFPRGTYEDKIVIRTIPISPEVLKRTAAEVFANPPKFPKLRKH